MTALTRSVDYSNIDESLLEMLEFYKSVFELSEDAKIVIQNDRIIKVNRAFITLTNATPEEIQSQGLHDFLIGLQSQDTATNCIVGLRARGDSKLIPVLISFNELVLAGKSTKIATLKDLTKFKIFGGYKVKKVFCA